MPDLWYNTFWWYENLLTTTCFPNESDDMIQILAAAASAEMSARSVPWLQKFIEEYYIETLAIFPALIILMSLAVVVYLDSFISDGLRRTMRIIVLAVFSLVVQNYLEYRLSTGDLRWLARTLVSVYGYAIRPVILVLFLRVLSPQKHFRWAWVLAGINAAVNATALFSSICFRIDEDNHYRGGPLNNFCLYVSAFLLVWLFAMTIRVFEPHKRRETWVPMLVFGLIVVSVVMDYNVGQVAQPVDYLTFAVVSGSRTYYTWLHMQFVRDHEQALQAEQRIQIMMSQIQPHFLHNTLATIRALCRRDADKAGEVTEKFGEYLRRNMAFMGFTGLVPFRTELEHTRIYAEIEMVRFDNIRVTYDIQDDRFELPPLTVQPLVENAIRHGVRIRDQGFVRVSSWRNRDAHKIMIWDNGTGFDTVKIDSADDSHIGIRNVRERIGKMCGGSLQIDSRIGEGTMVTITIPFREKNDEENE